MSWHVTVSECTPYEFDAAVDAAELAEDDVSDENQLQLDQAKIAAKAAMAAGVLGPLPDGVNVGANMAGHANPEFVTAPNIHQNALHISLFTYTR